MVSASLVSMLFDLSELPPNCGFQGYPPQIQRILDERAGWDMDRIEWRWQKNVVRGEHTGQLNYARHIVTEWYDGDLREVNYGNDAEASPTSTPIIVKETAMPTP